MSKKKALVLFKLLPVATEEFKALFNETPELPEGRTLDAIHHAILDELHIPKETEEFSRGDEVYDLLRTEYKNPKKCIKKILSMFAE